MSASLPVKIDRTSSVAPFEQLRLGIVNAVRAGTLAAGAKLPTVRGLATELGLAPNTVAKVYRELEQGGVIETRGRHGTFVLATGDQSRDAASRAAIDYVTTVRALGFDDREALDFVRAQLG